MTNGRASRLVQAPASTVFALVAEVELWPALFPQVRSARVLRRDGKRRLIEVRISWHGLPVGWRAVQSVEPADGSITFRVAGRSAAADSVIWTIAPANGTHATVSIHPQRSGKRTLVGPDFQAELGRRLLDRAQEIAEGGSLAGPR